MPSKLFLQVPSALGLRFRQRRRRPAWESPEARVAQERVRRKRLTREQLLEEHVANHACVCPTLGRNYDLAKDLLRKNTLDGPVQRAVLGALRAGRAKKRTVCLVGGTDCGKSFVVKGLKEVVAKQSGRATVTRTVRSTSC